MEVSTFLNLFRFSSFFGIQLQYKRRSPNHYRCNSDNFLFTIHFHTNNILLVDKVWKNN